MSFILYFSGVIKLYIFLRKRLLKQYGVIVLTYHRIRDDGEDPDISVSSKEFEKQITYLKKYFNIISLNTLVDNIEKQTNIVRDNIAITFDDGYKDNFLNAYPILKKYQMPATIFLVSKSVGKKEMLGTNELNLMKNNEIGFGSHTVTHKVLLKIVTGTATEEITYSKKELERLLNQKIQFFAYPKGKRNHFNEQIKALVKESGYKAAFTTENGEISNKSDLFELKRIGIRNCPLFVFKTRVSGIFESRLVYFLRKLLRMV